MFTNCGLQHILKLAITLRENIMYLNYIKQLTDGDHKLDKNKISEFVNKTFFIERRFC